MRVEKVAVLVTASPLPLLASAVIVLAAPEPQNRTGPAAVTGIDRPTDAAGAKDAARRAPPFSVAGRSRA